MRWKRKEIVYPRDGDKRIISKFLFIPKELNNEFRWLERARIEQVYHFPFRYGVWSDVRWIDKEKI